MNRGRRSWAKVRGPFAGIGTPLFHATTGAKAGSIIHQDGQVLAASGYSSFGNTQFRISMTRSLEFALRGDFGPYIFVFDRDELRKRFRIAPMSYWGSIKRAVNKHNLAYNESEEGVWTPALPLKYVKGLIIPRRLLPYELAELREALSGKPIVSQTRDGKWITA